MTHDADTRDDPDARRASRTVTLAEASPDQIEYLRQVQAATSDYDPDYLVRGRKPDEIGV